MKSAQAFLNDVQVIVDEINKNEDSISKTRLIQLQKNLSLIKKEVVETKKASNALHENKKANTNPGCLAFFLGRGYVRSINASNKRTIQNQKLQASSLYDQVIRNIDRCMIYIDSMKIKRN